MSATCPICEREQDLGLVCHQCTTVLERELAEVRALMGELDTTISKMARIGSGGKGAPARERSPINFGAVAVANDLTNTLTTWARDVMGKGWTPPPPRRTVFRAAAQPFKGPFCLDCEHPSCGRMRFYVDDPMEPVAIVASFALLGAVNTIRRHPAANELFDEITDAIQQARRAVDRPADRIYLGQCFMENPDDEGRMVTCLNEIFARPNASEAACRVCGAEHEVGERRVWLMQRARDTLLSPKDAALFIGEVGGIKVTEASIRGYVHRQKLAYRAPVDAKRFRLGDLLDLLVDESERKGAA